MNYEAFATAIAKTILLILVAPSVIVLMLA